MNDSDHLSVKRSTLSVERSSPAVDPDNPWPGLSTFTEESRGFFFGRDRETDELSRLVRRETLTVLFGQSGLGKSSLLQAGLFPLLRDSDHLPLYLRLDHSGVPIADCPLPIAQNGRVPDAIGSRQSPIGNSLADQVKAALNDAFVAAKAEAPPLGPDETLWEYFHRKDVDIWSPKNRLLTPVLAFDQFEEMFTLGRADDARRERSRAFLAELADLVENRPPARLKERFERGEADPTHFNFDKPSCRVILSLREDFLPDLEGLKQELPALIHNRLRLRRLNGAQALEAVSRPAPQLLAEGVGEKIVEFVAGSRGGSAERLLEMEVEPALLSVISRELNEKRRTLRQTQITPDLVSGNRREILTNFYERSVADLPEGMREFVEDRLLTKSGFRDNLALETALELPGVTRPLIDTLVARRLLRIEDRLGVQRVELTHDVLAEVIRGSRDARQQNLAIAAAAESSRKLRWLAGGLAAAVVLLGVGIVYGLHLRKREYQRMSQTDVGIASRFLGEGKNAEGFAYLLRAAERDPTNPSIAPRLASALTSRNYLLPEGPPLRLNSPVLRLIYSANGSKITAFCEDGTIAIIDTATGDHKKTKLPAGLPTYWFLVGEQKVAVRCNDNSLRVIDTDTGAIVREFKFDQPLVIAWGMNKDDPILFALMKDDSFVVCHTSTGQMHTLPMRRTEQTGFWFSQDGRWFATGEMPSRQLQLWDVSNREKLSVFSFPDDVLNWEFIPGNRLVVTFKSGRNVAWRLYSLPDGREIASKVMVESLDSTFGYTLASADGRYFYVRVSDGIRVYDATTGSEVGTMIPVTNTAAEFSPDGERLFTREAGNGRIWDVKTSRQLSPLMTHGATLRESRFTPDNRVLLTASADGFARLWDAGTGRLLAEPTVAVKEVTADVAPDGTRLAVGSQDGMVFRLRVGRGSARPLMVPYGEERNPAVFLDRSPSQIYLLSRQDARVLDLPSGRTTLRLPYPEPLRAGAVRAPQFLLHADTGLFGGRTDAGKWAMWRFTGDAVTPVSILETDWPEQSGPRISGDGKRVALVYGQRVRVWDVATGKAVGPEISNAIPMMVGAIQLDPDGRRVATGTALGEAKVWDTTTGKVLAHLKPMRDVRINSVRFTLDGKRLVTANDAGEVQIWDPATGKAVSPILNHPVVAAIQGFSRDGTLLLTATPRTVHVWDMATGNPVGEPIQHGTTTRSASFSPDGKTVLTVEDNGAIRLWDPHTSGLLTEPMQHPGRPRIGGFSPDGRFVRVETFEAKHFIWSVPPPMPEGTRVPRWLLDLATICASKTLNANGQFVSTTNAAVRIDDVRRTLSTLPDNAPYVEWGRWFLSDEATRSIAPGFTITPAEAEKTAAGSAASP